MSSAGRRAAGATPSAVALLLVLLTAALGAAAARADVEPGQLWLLPQYRVQGCEPMPRVPTVFNWLVRKALAVEEFLATSADCGQVGGRDAGEGWTYVFWSESDQTAVASLLRRARDKYGLTQLILKRRGEAHTVAATGYEPFFLIQLGGDQGPTRIWAAGDVKRLEGEISVAGPGELQVRVASVAHTGNRCETTRALTPGGEGGPRQALGCE